MSDQPPATLGKPLWRLPDGAQRRLAVKPFIGHRVELVRVWSRVARDGEQTYLGHVITVAITTTGSGADLVILESDEGTTWAISLAQVASIRHAPLASPRRTRG